MSKPRFALASLLKHYRHTEESCRLRVATSVRACDTAHDAIARLEEQLGNCRLRDVAHLATVERALVARTRALRTNGEEHERAHAALVDAARDRAVLEQLKARQQAEWMRRERRREEREAGW